MGTGGSPGGTRTLDGVMDFEMVKDENGYRIAPLLSVSEDHVRSLGYDLCSPGSDHAVVPLQAFPGDHFQRSDEARSSEDGDEDWRNSNEYFSTYIQTQCGDRKLRKDGVSAPRQLDLVSFFLPFFFLPFLPFFLLKRKYTFYSKTLTRLDLARIKTPPQRVFEYLFTLRRLSQYLRLRHSCPVLSDTGGAVRGQWQQLFRRRLQNAIDNLGPGSVLGNRHLQRFRGLFRDLYPDQRNVVDSICHMMLVEGARFSLRVSAALADVDDLVRRFRDERAAGRATVQNAVVEQTVYDAIQAAWNRVQRRPAREELREGEDEDEEEEREEETEEEEEEEEEGTIDVALAVGGGAAEELFDDDEDDDEDDAAAPQAL